VKNGKISVRKAAALHGIPEKKTRDKIYGNVSFFIVSAGKPPLFNSHEEKI